MTCSIDSEARTAIHRNVALSPPRRGWSRGFRRFITSLVLMSPAIVPYTLHYLTPKEGFHPTGYIQSDMPIYVAKAREYLDPDGFHFSYSNPCSYNYNGPRIYFQPWTFALGLVLRVTGLRPGSVYLGYWFLAALACSSAGLAFYRESVGLETWGKRVGLVIFFWGGGLLAVAGTLLGFATKGRLESLDTIFALDPNAGWWILNFGRNLVYPTESFYHAIFLMTMLRVIQGRYLSATLFALLTAASTPFTGLELLAILWSWSFLEVVFLEDEERLKRFFAVVTVILGLFLVYYLGFLNLFPSHRLLAAQMSLDWGYSAATFIPAYILVGGLAVWAVRRMRLAGSFFASKRNRLFLVWFVVGFVLANHEFAVSPRQPLHFTRGYVWMGLFFLGVRSLVDLFETLVRRLPRPLGIFAVGLVVAIFLSDNFVWFATFGSRYRKDLWLTSDQEQVLKRLDHREYYGRLLLCEDRLLSYLAIAETPLRSWVSHELETPHYAERVREIDNLFRKGRFIAAWDSTPLLIVISRHSATEVQPPWLDGRRATSIFQNRSFQIYKVDPIREDDSAAFETPASRSSVFIYRLGKSLNTKDYRIVPRCDNSINPDSDRMNFREKIEYLSINQVSITRRGRISASRLDHRRCGLADLRARRGRVAVAVDDFPIPIVGGFS